MDIHVAKIQVPTILHCTSLSCLSFCQTIPKEGPRMSIIGELAEKNIRLLRSGLLEQPDFKFPACGWCIRKPPKWMQNIRAKRIVFVGTAHIHRLQLQYLSITCMLYSFFTFSIERSEDIVHYPNLIGSRMHLMSLLIGKNQQMAKWSLVSELRVELR